MSCTQKRSVTRRSEVRKRRTVSPREIQASVVEERMQTSLKASEALKEKEGVWD